MNQMNSNKIESQVMINNFNDCQPILNDINWSFNRNLFYQKNEIIPFDSRKYLSYPATFIPHIPYTLIDILTKPGAKIFDPFAGSGTTFFQALILKRYPYTNDICKVSYEYIRNLYTLFNPEIDKSKLLNSIINVISKYDTSILYDKEFELTNIQKELKHWFSKNTFNSLVFLIKEKEDIGDLYTKSVLHVAILSVLKNTTCQDKSWGCIADNMKPKKYQIKDKDVFNKVYSNCKRIINDIENRIINEVSYSEFFKNVQLTDRVFNSDINSFNKLENNLIDCIITSPPYLNMTDYITSQRLAYYYLDTDPDKEKFSEIGARFKRARNNATKDYIEEMKLTNSILSSLLKTGGYLCLVLPEFNNSLKRDIKRKEAIDIILEDLELKFLDKKSTYERKIPTMRRSHNSFWATLEKEKIYIYQKVMQ